MHVNVVFAALVTLAFAREAARARRSGWCRAQLHAEALERLRARLLDLVPQVAVDRLAAGAAAAAVAAVDDGDGDGEAIGKPACEWMTAAVLQLDICGFTVLSAQVARQ